MLQDSKSIHLSDQFCNEDKIKKYRVGVWDPEGEDESILTDCSQRVHTIIFYFS